MKKQVLIGFETGVVLAAINVDFDAKYDLPEFLIPRPWIIFHVYFLITSCWGPKDVRKTESA